MTKDEEPKKLASALRRLIVFPIGASLAIGTIAGIGLSFQGPPVPASAAGLSCGNTYIDNAARNFVHSCSGSGNVKYTVHCIIGQPYIFTYKWKNGSSRLFDFSCSRGGTSVSWQLISG